MSSSSSIALTTSQQCELTHPLMLSVSDTVYDTACMGHCMWFYLPVCDIAYMCVWHCPWRCLHAQLTLPVTPSECGAIWKWRRLYETPFVCDAGCMWRGLYVTLPVIDKCASNAVIVLSRVPADILSTPINKPINKPSSDAETSAGVSNTTESQSEFYCAHSPSNSALCTVSPSYQYYPTSWYLYITYNKCHTAVPHCCTRGR